MSVVSEGSYLCRLCLPAVPLPACCMTTGDAQAFVPWWPDLFTVILLTMYSGARSGVLRACTVKPDAMKYHTFTFAVSKLPAA